MLIGFLTHLRNQRLPVSIREFLTLLEALRSGVMAPSIDEFHILARAILVKDERLYDRFDRAFGQYFRGLESPTGDPSELPEDWLRRAFTRTFSAAEKAEIERLGGLDALMKRLQQLLSEQHDRHEGGSKWIGTNGTSPFGNGGYHPEGIRVGGPSAGHRTAVKVWEERVWRDYDDQVEMGTRSIKLALRRLRRFAREGAETELDLDHTVEATARNAGWLDLQMRPERHNQVRVLMLLDVGGSMDDHVRRTEELFSAASSEFAHLETWYFHNCVYDHVWRHNERRRSESASTLDLIRTFGSTWRLVFVGDATMAPYEILSPGGSVEYHNEEAGAVWMRRLLEQYRHAAWLNPEPEHLWPYRQSVALMRQIMGGRMYPVTLAGIDAAVRQLARTG